MGSLIPVLDWSARRQDGDILLVDCRSVSEYESMHLPGAVNVPVGSWRYSATDPASMEAFRSAVVHVMRAIGVQSRTRIVCYETNAGYYASFGAMAFEYAGAASADVLDGGLIAWQRHGGEVARGKAPHTTLSDFEAAPDPSSVATADDVLAALGTATVIDVRSLKERLGFLRRSRRAGWIPGSVHIPWIESLSTYAFEDQAVLDRLFRSTQPDLDAPIITYCHGGWRASHMSLALERSGYTDVRTYIGSWGEWGNSDELPVEGGADAPSGPAPGEHG